MYKPTRYVGAATKFASPIPETEGMHDVMIAVPTSFVHRHFHSIYRRLGSWGTQDLSMMNIHLQPLYWCLVLLVVVTYIGKVLCSERSTSGGYCTADDGTGCTESENLGELEEQSVQRLNDTLILGKHPHRHIFTNCCSEVYVSVKTTASYHEPRLAILLLTWMQTLEPKQVISPAEL